MAMQNTSNNPWLYVQAACWEVFLGNGGSAEVIGVITQSLFGTRKDPGPAAFRKVAEKLLEGER